MTARRLSIYGFRSFAIALSLLVLSACGGSHPAAAGGTLPAVPSPPSDLNAVAGNAQVSLTWTTSPGASSYHVKRSTASGGPYVQVAAPTVTACTDRSLVNGTTYYYVVSALNAAGESPDSVATSAVPLAANVTVTVDPSQRRPISPYIYGINFYAGISGAPSLLTLDRAGGNRWTAYNWETNASNAGSDYLYENDNYLSSSATPAEAVRSFIAGDRAGGVASLITVQLQGLVAGDENGPVNVTSPPDLTRFKQAVPKKSTLSSVPFTMTPPVNDSYVSMDEFLWTLDQKFPGQAIFGFSPLSKPVFVQLDNEPELWNSTHLEVQGAKPIASDAYIAKTITLTRALKDQFPGLVVFGPVHYGFEGIYNWQGELTATPGGSDWFPDKYLPALRAASNAYGRPLVDVYDFHWYSEATDGSGNRVTSLTGATLTDAQVQAIAQSPRSLWDPSYTENSWIARDVLGEPINMLGRLQSRIAVQYPAMTLAMTEYHNGGSQHIAGTLAQADNLGIFGAQGLYAANFWPLSSNEAYVLAGFRAYRGFDGAQACFGDTSLQAASNNIQAVAVYASEDSAHPGRTVFVAVNRSTSAQVTAITGQPLSGTAHLYRMTAATAQGQSPIKPVPAGTMTVSGSSITLSLPPLSVTTIDIY